MYFVFVVVFDFVVIDIVRVVIVVVVVAVSDMLLSLKVLLILMLAPFLLGSPLFLLHLLIPILPFVLLGFVRQTDRIDERTCGM